jgi:3-dehydroquinate synthase
VVILTQPTIARRWAGVLSAGLEAGGLETPEIVTFPAGERYKTVGTIQALYTALYNLSPALDRRTLIVALGGGVVGDMAGFVAATYLRGLDYVQVPTTLLAMVDSSVGGKTGVDFRAGKNLIGAFHQPRLVLADLETLSTLPVREFRSGMAEVVKYGVIQDAGLLNTVTATFERSLRTNAGTVLQEIVARCCEIKAEVVAGDEFEMTGLRAILNFGHTIGHALESATNYRRYRHGEAVAIGMVAAAHIGEEAGITPPDVCPAILAALEAQGLPSALPSEIAPDVLIDGSSRDKKALGGVARFVLAERIGKTSLFERIDADIVRRGICRSYGA